MGRAIHINEAERDLLLAATYAIAEGKPISPWIAEATDRAIKRMVAEYDGHDAEHIPMRLGIKDPTLLSMWGM